MADEPQSGPVKVRNPDGAEYVVTDAASVSTAHPDAQILGYEDGREFVRTRDASLIAQREAETKTRAKEREQAKAEKQTTKDEG